MCLYGQKLETVALEARGSSFGGMEGGLEGVALGAVLRAAQHRFESSSCVLPQMWERVVTRSLAWLTACTTRSSILQELTTGLVEC